MANGENLDDAADQTKPEKLKQERNIFRNIVDNIPHAVYFKDKESRFIWISKIYESTYGNVIGKTSFDLYPEDLAREATEDDKRVVETGKPMINKEVRFTHLGSEQYYLITKAPVFDDKGDVIGIVGITTDITKRKQAEKKQIEAERDATSKMVAAEAAAKIAAATSEVAQKYKGTISELKLAQEKLIGESNLLQNLLGNVPAFIYFKDKDGRYIQVSKLYQKTRPKSMIGKTDFDFYPKEQAEKMTEDDKRVMRTGKPIIEKEERFTARGGSKLHLLTTKAPLFGRDGDIVGIVGIARDATKRKAEKIKKGIKKTRRV